MSEWVRLLAGNDWGKRYYAVSPLSHGSADANRGLHFEDGELLPVRWPDGTTSVELIALCPYRELIGDMGHDYWVEGKEPKLKINHRGVIVFVRLVEIEVPAERVR